MSRVFQSEPWSPQLPLPDGTIGSLDQFTVQGINGILVPVVDAEYISVTMAHSNPNITFVKREPDITFVKREPDITFVKREPTITWNLLT